jgi:hypothetical protein
MPGFFVFMVLGEVYVYCSVARKEREVKERAQRV